MITRGRGKTMTRIRRETVPTTTKINYALGGAAEGATAWAFNGFSFIIYTIMFGMPGSLVGAAIFLSIVLDAISDPLVGYVSDRWRSRLGRRHPFIFFASLPLGASIFCIYVPPDLLLASNDQIWSFLGYQATPQQWGLAVWLFVFASLLKFFLTCYHLPHLALGSELSDNYLERTRIFRYNTLFSFGGGAALAWTFYNVFFERGPQPGLDTTWFASAVAVFGAIVIFLTAWLTRNQIPYLLQPPQIQERFSLVAFFKASMVVFRNHNYMMLFFGLLCLSSLTGVRETLNANMSLYYWELPPRLIGYFPFFSMASYFVAVAVVAALNQRFDKGGTMRLAVGTAILAASVPVLGRSFGVFPDNGSPLLFPLLGGFVFLYYGSLAVLTTSVYSAIGDVVDEQELTTGQRDEGIFYAVRTFFAKLSNGLGHLLAGIAIDVIGFPPNAVVGQVPGDVIFELGIFEGVIAAIPALGAIYFYGRYRIDKGRHREIVDELEARRLATADVT
jgi:Na+/melibiose symporter-like transporter